MHINQIPNDIKNNFFPHSDTQKPTEAQHIMKLHL